MLNQVAHAIARSSRLLVLRQTNAFHILLFRKAFTRPEHQTVGGMMTLAAEDEADYEWQLVGKGKMLILGRMAGGDWAINNLDYGENEINAYIEPLEYNAFVAQREDRVVWVLPDLTKHFQINEQSSPLMMPQSRLAVYRLQPIEEPFGEA